MVNGYGAEIGDHLTSHQDINFVTFTGSSVIGQHISEIVQKTKHQIPWN